MARSSAVRRKPPIQKAAPEPVVEEQVQETALPANTHDPETGEPIDADTLEGDEGADADVEGDEGDDEGTAASDPEPAPESPAAPVADAPVVAAPVTADEAPKSPRGRLTEEDLQNSEFRKYYQEILDESGVVAPAGQILFPHEPLTFTTAEVHKDHIILTEDVYRMILPFRSARPTFAVIAFAGRRIDDPTPVSRETYLAHTADLLEDIINPE